MMNINNKTYNDLKEGITTLNNNLNTLERRARLKEKIQILTDVATLIIIHHSQISENLMNILQNSVNGKIINVISQNQLKMSL